jgi:flavin-dependent dehydrogenase
MISAHADYEVAIIGAGPAGSAAALTLARAGRHVVLLERRQFPRDKVCGGCLSGRAVAQLRALIGADEAERDADAAGRDVATGLPGVAARQITFVMGSYRLTCDPQGLTRVVRRSELDAWLAVRAAAAGADVRFGQTAGLVRGADGWDVTVGDTRLRARTILLGCGLSTLPAKIGIVGRVQRRRMIAQQWMQPVNSALPTLGSIEMHWLRGGYVGLATPAADQCVVAMAADLPAGCVENVWTRLRRLNPAAPLWSRLPADALRRFVAKGTAGFPWTPQQLGIDNVLLLGDAAGYEEPFTGEGMGQAVCSAACAARAVLDGGDVLRHYTASMRASREPSARRLRTLGRVLRNPLVRFLASGPALLPRRPLAQWLERVHVQAPAREMA